MIGGELVFFYFLYIKLFELGVEAALNNRSAVTHHKSICSNSNSGAAALSAAMMLSCCSCASASVASRNPSSLSVDRLNSQICTIFRASSIATIIRSPAPETIYEERPWIEVVLCLLTFFDLYCHLYILCLLRQLFLAADSQKLFLSPQRAHVTFFVKRDNFELAFWLLCSVQAVIQVPPDGVVGNLK